MTRRRAILICGGFPRAGFLGAGLLAVLFTLVGAEVSAPAKADQVKAEQAKTEQAKTEQVKAGQAGAEQASCALNGEYDIEIRVENLRSSEGLLTVELYNDDPEGFIKKSGRLHRDRIAIEGSGNIACLSAPGPGTYAVVLYHDENANEKFDKGFLGIPVEGFGISRNPPIGFSKPPLEEAAFTLDGKPIVLDIKMNYL